MFPTPDLQRWSKPVVFKPGEVLVREGDVPGLVRLLTSGVAKVTVVVADRSGGVRSPLLALRTSGSLLGGVPAVLGGTHVASVTAITPCEARALAVDTFCRLVVHGGDSEVPAWLIRQQAREIREHVRRAVVVATKNMEDHFVWLIVHLFQASHHRQPDGSLALSFPLTVTDIAQAMGLLSRPRRDLWFIAAVAFLGSVFAVGGAPLSAVAGWIPGPWCEGSDPGACEADCGSEAFAHCDWVCDQRSEEWTGNWIISQLPGADCQEEDAGDHQYHGLVYCECS